MGNVIHLSFNELIKPQTVRGFIERICKLCDDNPECEEVVITISTGGGDVDLAIELYNFLKSLNCRITTINSSYVNSAGVIIFLAGDKRICMEGASFYVHSVTKKISGEYNSDMLEREIQEIKANTYKITSLLESHTMSSKSSWSKLMKKGTIILPKRAMRMGLITQI